MKQIDRYILKTYLFSLLVCMFSLVGLYVVMDLFQKIDNFLRKGEGLLELIVHYYAWQVPFHLLQFVPIVTVLAAILTLTRLAKSNELVPMKAAGISIHRVILPMFFVAVVTSGLIVWVQNDLIPRNAESIQISRLLTQRNERSSTAQIVDSSHEDYNLILFCARYSITEQTMKDVSIDWVTKDFAPYHDGTFRSNHLAHAFADRVVWEYDASLNRDAWHIYNDSGLSSRIDQVKRQTNQPGAQRMLKDGELIDLIYTPSEIALMIRNVSLSLLGGSNTQFLTATQLKQYCDQHPHHLSERVALYQRATLPLSNLILFLLASPFVLRRHSDSTLVGVGVAMAVCLIYYAVAIVCQSLGATGTLQPFLAAVLPVAAFLTLAIYKFDTIPT